MDTQEESPGAPRRRSTATIAVLVVVGLFVAGEVVFLLAKTLGPALLGGSGSSGFPASLGVEERPAPGTLGLAVSLSESVGDPRGPALESRLEGALRSAVEACLGAGLRVQGAGMSRHQVGSLFGTTASTYTRLDIVPLSAPAGAADGAAEGAGGAPPAGPWFDVDAFVETANVLVLPLLANASDRAPQLLFELRFTTHDGAATVGARLEERDGAARFVRFDVPGPDSNAAPEQP